MYPKFIEVHYENGFKAFLNVENIEGFRIDNSDGCVVFLTSMAVIKLKESYEEMQQLIKNSGCLIRKQDPRLDVTHPLTIDDLQNMVGEPVWNTSISEWGLITKNAEWHGEIQEGLLIRYHDGSMTRLEEEWLQKFPLYRMRQ